MSQIAYDPVKDRLAKWVRKSRILRTLFYITLDLFFLRSWHIRKTVRNLFDDSSQPLRVLDAGCGFGQYDRFLLKTLSASRILAVDVKEDYLEDCRKYFAREIKAGRIIFENRDLLDFRDEGYDLILCVDVLEHIEQDVKVMRNLRESLAPGGYLMMHSPSDLAGEDAGDDEFFVDEHARAGYSSSELRSKFRQAGLETVGIRYTYGTFGHAAWVLMIKWPMLTLNKVGFAAILLLPFWYLIVFLPSMALNSIDVKRTNREGTGIVGLARRAGKQL
jgi:SAM-dependent methyltransferase